MKRLIGALAVTCLACGPLATASFAAQTKSDKASETLPVDAAKQQQAQLDRLEKELSRAQASGDAAQIAAAQERIDKFKKQMNAPKKTKKHTSK